MWTGVHGMSVRTVQRAHAACSEQSLQGSSKIPHSHILPETPQMYCTSKCELIWWLYILKPFSIVDICRTPTFSYDGHHDPNLRCELTSTEEVTTPPNIRAWDLKITIHTETVTILV